MKTLLISFCFWAGLGLIPIGATLADYTACWIPPTENTDGTPLTDLDGFKLWAIPAGNTYGSPAIFPVQPPTACVPGQQADCHFIKPTGENCYFKFWPSPAGDWKLKMQAFNTSGVDSADSAEILFTLVDLDGDGNPDVDKGVIPNLEPGPPDTIAVECPACQAGGRSNEFNVTRSGYFTITGPDGQWLTKPDGSTRNLTTREEAFEWISKDGRGGEFVINPPPYRVVYQ